MLRSLLAAALAAIVLATSAPTPAVAGPEIPSVLIQRKKAPGDAYSHRSRSHQPYSGWFYDPRLYEFPQGRFERRQMAAPGQSARYPYGNPRQAMRESNSWRRPNKRLDDDYYHRYQSPNLRSFDYYR